jgi:hypothetical protein
MGTTSLWRVHGWLGKLVVYVENPDKTENPKFYGKTGMTEHQAQGLADVIEYAASAGKTAMRTGGEATPAMQQFVSGVNVSPITARDSMLRTKREFDKTGGVVAYHGYQSFAPGEATPEIAHEIGMKLAWQLWGGRYQVLVATHLDKSDLLHNHFIINTVSHIDGKKFHRTEKDYYDMQKASDALCREYGLSVIEEPKRGKSKQYGEWQAERNGHPTWRGMVKSDVDTAIRQSMTERQFFDNLRKMGYEIKPGKDISVRPPGKERFVRLCRNFGDDYAIEGIRRRILAQARPERKADPPSNPPKKARFQGSIHKVRKLTGLRALYFYYLYRMGALPKKREPNPKRVYFLFREDIRFIRNISQQARLLVKHGIDTDVQLAAHKDTLQAQIDALCENRKHLRYRARGIKGGDALEEAKAEIKALTERIAELRREVRLCGDIERRSGEMLDKIRSASEDEKSKTKEVRENEPFRRRR